MLRSEIQYINSSKKNLRKFGLTVGGVLVLIGVLFFLFNKVTFPYFTMIGLLLISLGLLIPQSLKPIYKAWMISAVIMGWIMTRVILIILFFLILTPISFMLKLFGKRTLDLKMDIQQVSYWNYREPVEFTTENYEKQF